MISAFILADSVGPNGVRITSFELKYPRFMHAELMTHRAFSRNASSSRAIPVKKQIQLIKNSPAVPMAFTKNKPGMQGGILLEGEEHQKAVSAWLRGCDRAIEIASELADLEVHKQYANRVLEPYAHISVVLTATDFDNFYWLRWHKDALPEMQALAKAMWLAQQGSTPRELSPGMLHLPLVTNDEYLDILLKFRDLPGSNYYDPYDDPAVWELWMPLIKRSVARCARVSYLNHEGGESTFEQDEALYKKLRLSDEQPHASPLEHQAMCVHYSKHYKSGNFRGWKQFRHMVYGDTVRPFVPPEGDLKYPDQGDKVTEGDKPC